MTPDARSRSVYALPWRNVNECPLLAQRGRGTSPGRTLIELLGGWSATRGSTSRYPRAQFAGVENLFGSVGRPDLTGRLAYLDVRGIRYLAPRGFRWPTITPPLWQA